MQRELEADHPELAIQILGVNEQGHEGGNESFCAGRDLPWLQDSSSAGWWERWSPTYRDVVILDGEGALIEAYNLTSKPITDEGNYAELEALLISAAQAQ